MSFRFLLELLSFFLNLFNKPGKGLKYSQTGGYTKAIKVNGPGPIKQFAFFNLKIHISQITYYISYLKVYKILSQSTLLKRGKPKMDTVTIN